MSEKEYKQKCENMFIKNSILINENETLKTENQQLKQQLAAITEDRDKWKQRAIDTYGEC